MSNSIPSEPQAALIIAVPQAEELVRTYRDRYDPAAAVGVPAHVTVNYPFLDGLGSQGAPLTKLRRLFLNFPAFDFVLSEIRRWPDVLYLAPEPPEPFIDLAMAVAQAFPDSPPYGGAFRDIVPHLTVADSEDAPLLDALTHEFAAVARAWLPIASRAEQVLLIDNLAGRWATSHSFALAASGRRFTWQA
jgi:hypothetical protein